MKLSLSCGTFPSWTCAGCDQWRKLCQLSLQVCSFQVSQGSERAIQRMVTVAALARLGFLFLLHLVPLAVGDAVQDMHLMRRSWCGSWTARSVQDLLRMSECLLICSPVKSQVMMEEILSTAETSIEGSSPAEGQVYIALNSKRRTRNLWCLQNLPAGLLPWLLSGKNSGKLRQISQKCQQ